MHIKRLSLLLLLALPLALPALPQKMPALLYGNVIDALTHELIEKEVEVALLSLDSAVVDTAISRVITDEGNGEKRAYWQMEIPEQATQDFILRFSCDGYETTYKPAKLRWAKHKQTVLALYKYLQLRRRPLKWEQQLQEVTVTGTKIKFYIKGDTLVYNADAFQLKEGSMLDALISQLPGAELDTDGRITVNGKPVESLLLNGRDFFKDDNTVLLDNLPAYMVQQVQVYEKESELSKAAGAKVDEGELVMDVKLKKKYAVGWLGNAEVGYGNEERYMSRLFAMRYTPQSRIAIFGNMNNVNDRRKPDGNGGWGSIDPTGGLTATKLTGMNYSVYDKLGKYDISGEVGMTYSDNTNVYGGTSTNFVTGGNTYESTKKNSQSSSLSLSTTHRITAQIGSRGYISIQPTFNYYKNDYTSEYTNGTFSAQPTEGYATVLDSLFSPDWAATVRNMIKRNGEWAEGNGHGSNGKLFLWAFYKPLSYSTDGIYLNASVAYSDKNQKERNHFTYNWFEDNATNNDYRDRYNDSPSHDFSYSAMAKYIWHWGVEWMFQPSYEFEYQYSSGDRLHYYVETESDSHDLQWSQSQMEQLMESIDTDNSYQTSLHKYLHTITFNWQYNKYATMKEGNGGTYTSWHINIEPKLKIERSDLDFICATQGQQVGKTYALPQMRISAKHSTGGNKHALSADLNIKSSSPSMMSMVDKTFSSDPLNVTLGNPDLKRRTDYSAVLRYESRQWLKDKGRSLYASTGVDIASDIVAVSYTYDKTTGVRTTKPTNVNGYWHPYINAGYTTPLDKQKKLTLKLSSRGSLYHKIDYSSNTSAVEPIRVKTDEYYYTGDAKLSYRHKKLSVGLSANLSYNHTTASRDDFDDVDTWAYRYGANAVAELPLQMQLSTDITMFSRRGFASRDKNRDDLVWNARIAKTLWKGRLTVMLDAWDILGNLSNVVSGVNSQRRWEYYYNVIPRYAMLRVAYKFDKQPKKRQ